MLHVRFCLDVQVLAIIGFEWEQMATAPEYINIDQWVSANASSILKSEESPGVEKVDHRALILLSLPASENPASKLCLGCPYCTIIVVVAAKWHW